MKLQKKFPTLKQCIPTPIILSALLASVIPSNALTITSGPTVSENGNAPLTAAFELTTDEYSRVSVSVSNGQATWQRNFYDYGTTHSVPVLGLQPNQTNMITVTVYDRYGNSVTAPQVSVITSRLPTDFPVFTLVKSVPERMEPGYTLFRVINQNTRHGYLAIVDSSGQPAWFTGITSVSEVKQLENGDLLFNQNASGFVEMTPLGEIVNIWPTPTNLTIDVHEMLPTDRGTLLYQSNARRVVTNFPSSSIDPSAPTRIATVAYQPVVELAASNAAVLNIWSPIDMVDPRRIDYLTFQFVNALGVDWEHGNAIIQDPHEDSLIVSMRHQDALIKFSRATGKLQWILGAHANWPAEFQKYLFQPVGAPFEWTYGQHGPTFTPQGTLLIYDDGNYRASPFETQVANSNNYSRAVEYKLDEKNMLVSQVWEYGRTNGDRLYTDRVGNTQWLPKKGNVLLTFGYVLYENGLPNSRYSSAATMLRIKEVTHEPNPQVVFDLACFDYNNTNKSYLGTAGYRSYRIPDLYPVVNAAREVADLIPQVSAAGARRSQILIGSLGAAVEALGQGELQIAIRRLGTFQLLTGLANLSPDVADELIYQAQGIVDALRAGYASYASERLTGAFSVFSPYHALADLMSEVSNNGLRGHMALLTSLEGALTCIGDKNVEAAVRNLRAFQSFIRNTQMSPHMASQLEFQAQRVIDAITHG